MDAPKDDIALDARKAFQALERRAATAEAALDVAKARASAAEARTDVAEGVLARLERLAEMLAGAVARLERIERNTQAREARPTEVVPEADPTADDASAGLFRTHDGPTRGRKMSDESDLLNGYEEIARFLHWPPYTAKRQALDGLIPTFKVGRIVCARRSTLNAWLAEQEAASQEGR